MQGADSPLPAGNWGATISSLAAASDHIDHLRSQVPYALIGAAGTVGLYLLVA